MGKKLMKMKNDADQGEGCSRITDAERQKVSAVLKSKVHTREGWTDPKKLKTFRVSTQ